MLCGPDLLRPPHNLTDLRLCSGALLPHLADVRKERSGRRRPLKPVLRFHNAVDDVSLRREMQ